MICNCCEKNKALPDNVWCASCMEHNSEWTYDKANTVEKWSKVLDNPTDKFNPTILIEPQENQLS